MARIWTKSELSFEFEDKVPSPAVIKQIFGSIYAAKPWQRDDAPLFLEEDAASTKILELPLTDEIKKNIGNRDVIDFFEQASDVSGDEREAPLRHRRLRLKDGSIYKLSDAANRKLDQMHVSRRSVPIDHESDPETRTPRKTPKYTSSPHGIRNSTHSQRHNLGQPFFARQRISAFDGDIFSGVQPLDDDDDLNNVEEPQDPELRVEDFILRQCNNVTEFVDFVGNVVDLYAYGEPRALNMLRFTLTTKTNTSGALWFRHLPRLYRDRLICNLSSLLHYIQEPALVHGYRAWCARHEYAEDDYAADHPEPPQSTENPHRWPRTLASVEEFVDLPLDKHNDIWKHLGVDGHASYEGLTDEEKKTWFERAQESSGGFLIAPSVSKNYGTAPQENKVPRDLGFLDADKSAVEQAGSEAAQMELLAGTSYPYSCIVMHDRSNATFYDKDTLDALACNKDPVISTSVRIHANHYQRPYVVVEYTVLCRKQRFVITKANIPFHSMLAAPEVKVVTAKDVRYRMRELGFSGNQVRPAHFVRFVARTKEIRLEQNLQAQRELAAAGFPELEYIIQHISEQYCQEMTPFDLFIADKWRDFPNWAGNLVGLYNFSLDDPLAAIRLNLAASSVVEMTSLNTNLDESTTRLPAVNQFDSLADMITILSDAACREQQFEKIRVAQVRGQRVKVVVQPVGSTKVEVPDPTDKNGNKTIKVPYTYIMSIIEAEDMEKLVESMPPAGSPVVCEVAMDFVAKKQTLHERSDEEKCTILGGQLIEALSDAHSHPVPKFEPPSDWKTLYRFGKIDEKGMEIRLRKAVRDHKALHHRAAAVARIIPFVKDSGLDADTPMTVAHDKLNKIDRYALALLKKFDRQGTTDEDGKTKMESKKDWKDRVIKGLRTQLNYLQLPDVTKLNTPRWIGIRHDMDGPARKISDLNFLMKLPRQPNWNTKKNGPAPYILPRLPPMPVYQGSTDEFVQDILANKKKLCLPAVFSYAADENTIAYRLKGLKKLELDRDDPAFQWLSSPTRAPATADLFGIVRILDRVRYHVIQAQSLSPGELYDFESMIPSDDLVYPEEQLDAAGNVNPITTKQYQVQANIALRNLVKQALDFDRDQMQAFLDLDKAPYGMVFLQGCPGSGKSSMANFIANAVRVSELVPTSGPNNVKQHITYPELEEVTDISSRKPIEFQEEIVDFTGLTLISGMLPTPETQPGKVDAPEPEQEKKDVSVVDVPVTISFPPLSGGPSKEDLVIFLEQLRTEDIANEEYLDTIMDKIRADYMEKLKADLAAWRTDKFTAAFTTTFLRRSVAERAELFPKLLDMHGSRFWYRGIKHFDEWARHVRSAFRNLSEEGVQDDPAYSVIEFWESEKSRDAAISAQNTPQPTNPKTTDTPAEQSHPSGDKDELDFALEDLEGKADGASTTPTAPLYDVHSTIMIIINRNEHGERAASDMLRQMQQTNPDKMHVAIKVNNLELEEARLSRDVFGIDPRITTAETCLSTSELITMSLGVQDAKAFAMQEGVYSRNPHGGMFTLTSALYLAIKANREVALADLLKEAADSDIDDPERNKQIKKLLMKAYKKILLSADVVVCTPVMAAKLAEKELFDPTVVVFDEAGMMAEADTLCVMLHFPATRHWILAGDHRQGGVIIMSDDFRQSVDSATKLYRTPSGEDAKKPMAHYRLKREIASFKHPFMKQMRRSMLGRIDKLSKHTSRLMINHRQEGELELIASKIAYDGKMESRHYIRNLSAPAERLHDFLSENVLKGGNMDGNRVTIFNAGTPTKQGTSWSNESQCNLALHIASKIHHAGITNDKGQLVSILITTPYAQATRNARRLLARMSDWEVCKELVDVRTIDNAQGSEYDVVITCYIRAGGFLHEPERPVVAMTRSRYAAIDIMDSELVEKRGPHWWHFQVYGMIQDGKHATIADQRDWSVRELSTRTFMPKSTKIAPRELWCPRCDKIGHHVRNCASRPAKNKPDSLPIIPKQRSTETEQVDDNGGLDKPNQDSHLSKTEKKDVLTDLREKEVLKRLASLDNAYFNQEGDTAFTNDGFGADHEGDRFASVVTKPQEEFFGVPDTAKAADGAEDDEDGKSESSIELDNANDGEITAIRMSKTALRNYRKRRNEVKKHDKRSLTFRKVIADSSPAAGGVGQDEWETKEDQWDAEEPDQEDFEFNNQDDDDSDESDDVVTDSELEDDQDGANSTAGDWQPQEQVGGWFSCFPVDAPFNSGDNTNWDAPTPPGQLTSASLGDDDHDSLTGDVEYLDHAEETAVPGDD